MFAADVPDALIDVRHHPLVSVGLLVLALLLLLHRRRRLERGALAQTLGLESELRRVHRAARRRLFTEAALGAAATLLVAAALSILESSQPIADGRRFLALLQQLAGNVATRPVGSVVHFGDSRRLPLLWVLALALFLLYAWSHWLSWQTSRHHWFATLRWLHRRRDHQPFDFEQRTSRALAYATDVEMVADAVRSFFARAVTLQALWYDNLLLLINQRHQELLTEKETQGKRLRMLDRILRACAQHQRTLLVSRRIATAFGGPFVLTVAAWLLFFLVTGCVAVWWQVLLEAR